MKNNKGQALVEFVIIAPVFIMLIMSVIDIGNVMYKKYQLENDLDYIVDLYRENKSDEINKYAKKEGFHTSVAQNGLMTTITLSKNVKISTPVINLIMSNPYEVIVDRVIYVE